MTHASPFPQAHTFFCQAIDRIMIIISFRFQLYAQCAEQSQEIKSLETQRNELQQLLEESQNEESNLRSKLGVVQRELTQVKATKADLEERMMAAEKEARQNAGEYLSVHLSVCLYVCLSVCLSVYHVRSPMN